jgi:hypothetical protein
MRALRQHQIGEREIVTDYLDPQTGSREKPEPSHEWKTRPTGEDADGTEYEVFTDALGVIAKGKVTK